MKRHAFLALTLAIAVVFLVTASLAGCTDLQKTQNEADTIAGTTLAEGTPTVTGPSSTWSTVTTMVPETAGSTTEWPVPTTAGSDTETTSEETSDTTSDETTSTSAGGIITIDPHVTDLDPGSMIAALITRYEETDPHLHWAGTWITHTDPGFSGGSAKVGVLGSGAWVDVLFTGTFISVIGAKYDAAGEAHVYLDSEPPVEVSYMLAGRHFQQVIWSSGPLSPGLHHLRIDGDGGEINLDALDVVGSLTSL